MIKQIKTFFNNTKGVFVGITTLLWIGALGLVFADKIDFSVYLGSLSTISLAVIGLYQFFISKEKNEKIDKLENQLDTSVEKLTESVIRNLKLVDKINTLETERTQAKEAIKEPVKKTRKPRAKKTTK